MKKIFIFAIILAAIAHFDYFINGIPRTVAEEAGKNWQGGISPELRLRLDTIQKRMQSMREVLYDYWKKKGHDPEYGGFYGTLDRRGRKSTPTDKSLIQQTRHLWVFSTLYRYVDPSPDIKSIADDLYEFIIRHFYDASDNQFFFMVHEDGSLSNPKKLLYAESFAIYGLAQYSIAFKNREAADYALNCFRSFDSRIHDEVNGGYDQSSDPGWLSEGAAKGTNTHMHLVESLTALYEATGDAQVRKRLEELVSVFLNKIIQSENYCHTQFKLDWTPHVKPVAEYGHDLQTAWLLMNAAQALERIEDPAIIKGVLAIGLRSAESGFDSEKGGYFFSGTPRGEVIKFDKVWWVQAESLSGLWWMFKLTGDSAHLDRLEATLDWIENYQQDSLYGEWFAEIKPDGTYSQGGKKGMPFKTGYHNTRALLFVERWIDEYLKK